MSDEGLLRLDPALVATLGTAAVEERVRRFVRTVRFELVDHACAVRLLGPDVPYHRLDAWLADSLADYAPDLHLDDVVDFHRPEGPLPFCLCMEDSWTGRYVAEMLEGRARPDSLVVVHVDDHRDMMSTLLVRHGERLIDPVARTPFDPSRPDDWDAAIANGSIGIGSFLTPLFDAAGAVHIRHLDNTPGPLRAFAVRTATVGDPLIRDARFASLELVDAGDAAGSAGTYVAAADPVQLLAAIPDGLVVVHIDLDYFVNDFNGNPGDPDRPLRAGATQAGLAKLDAFFDAVDASEVPVGRWIVGTSPGFCSALHWPPLLARIAGRIARRGDPPRF